MALGVGRAFELIGKGLRVASDVVFSASPIAGVALGAGAAFFRWASDRQGSGEQGAPMPLGAKDVEHQRQQAQQAAHAAPPVERHPEAQRGSS